MYKLEPGKFIPEVLWQQRDIKVVTKVFWQLPQCILLSSFLFSFNSMESSPKNCNPSWISCPVPPVILTLGTAVLWKSAPFPLPESYGKKLSWSYQECSSSLPCGCAAFGETGVTKHQEEQARTFPWKSWRKAGGSGHEWIRQCCLFASWSWRKVGET